MNSTILKKNYGFDVFTVDDWMFPADLRSSAIYHRCDYLRNVLLSTSLTRMTSSGSKQWNLPSEEKRAFIWLPGCMNDHNEKDCSPLNCCWKQAPPMIKWLQFKHDYMITIHLWTVVESVHYTWLNYYNSIHDNMITIHLWTVVESEHYPGQGEVGELEAENHPRAQRWRRWTCCLRWWGLGW